MDIPISKDVVAASRVAALHPIRENLKPEWLRVSDAVRIFGLSRSHLYELIAAGAIKSTALKKHGAVRGIRLLSFASLSAYIERAANGEGLVQ